MQLGAVGVMVGEGLDEVRMCAVECRGAVVHALVEWLYSRCSSGFLRSICMVYGVVW